MKNTHLLDNRISFSTKLLQVKEIHSFLIEPVCRKWNEIDQINTIQPCEPNEAEAWAVSATTENEGKEWIADLATKGNAEQFVQLLQDVVAPCQNVVVRRAIEILAQCSDNIDEDNPLWDVVNAFIVQHKRN
jgi:hypothetical protein